MDGRPASAIYSVGQAVEGLFISGRWYPAVVVQVNRDGTYTVEWADGVAADNIKCARELRPAAAAGNQRRSFPVLLRVYEIGSAGAYHAAVEVHGQEWQYGSGGGIGSIRPGTAEAYVRQLPPVFLGHTRFGQREVAQIIARMRRNWKGNDYNLIHKNCCHFARSFLHELGAQPMPEWVDGWTDKVVPTVEAGVGAIASRGVVLGAELVVARAVTLSAGPAAWGAAAGDLVGGGIGSRLGGHLGGAQGEDVGREVGSFGGSVATGAGVGACCAGPIGAGIGAGVGVFTWGVSKLVRTAINELPAMAENVMASSAVESH